MYFAPAITLELNALHPILGRVSTMELLCALVPCTAQISWSTGHADELADYSGTMSTTFDLVTGVTSVTLTDESDSMTWPCSPDTELEGNPTLVVHA